MWSRFPGRVWFHVYLILSDYAQAARKLGGEEDREPLIASDDGEASLGGAPSLVSPAGGCKGKKADRCKWLRCKHDSAKTRLEREKYESDVEVQQKAADTLRAFSEDRAQRYMETTFLTRIKTGRHMYAAVNYAVEAKAKKCGWANDALPQFEAWLENLFPAQHECVKKVIDLHSPAEQICSEAFTHEFKKALRDACQDDFGPRVENEMVLDKLKRNARDPYALGNFATTGLAATGALGTVLYTGLGVVGFLALGLGAWAFVPAIAVFAITVPALARLICIIKDRRRVWNKFHGLKGRKTQTTPGSDQI